MLNPRKLTAILLSALLVLPLLAGCDDSSILITGDRSNAETAGPSNLKTADFTELIGAYFTCVATDRVSANAVTATVCEAYEDLLGSHVRIEMKGLGELNIAAGDEIQVKIERVEATNMPVVYAEAVQVISLGENHASDGTVTYETDSGQELGIFPILALSEYSVSTELPTADEMKARSFTLTELAGPVVRMMRVVDIQDGIVYLAYFNTPVVNCALVGVPEISFSLGDFLLLTVSKYFHLADKPSIDIIYLEDVTQVRIPSEQEIAQQYYFSSLLLGKPVIYLYPEEEMTCSVKVDLDGTLTCTYPDHGADGWQNFTARPDGTLIFPDGSEYYCLYWEGRADLVPDFSRGFCVKGSDTAAFLAEILPEMGLTAREANEFIIYWLPILQENPYNLISFQDEAYTSIAELEITPAPDSLLRVYMTAKPLSEPIEIEPQTFDGFERNGFTVVEWGGSIVEE